MRLWTHQVSIGDLAPRLESFLNQNRKKSNPAMSFYDIASAGPAVDVPKSRRSALPSGERSPRSAMTCSHRTISRPLLLE